MTKAYVLKDISTGHYVVEKDKGLVTPEYNLVESIEQAKMFEESELIFAIHAISRDCDSPCYGKKFIEIVIWIAW